MVSFDLNNVRGAAPRSPTQEFQPGAFQGDVLASVKTVKRLSAHPWPFSVKSDADRQAADAARPALASSFVT